MPNLDFDKVDYQGGTDLEGLATWFVKRSYLEQLTSLPRMQDIPESAFVRNCRSPIFVSHRWHDGNRPASSTLTAIRSFVPNHPDVGLWIDYCCVPQKLEDGTDDRTALEKRYFTEQLQYIPTIVLKSQMVVLWRRRDAGRAWCVVEYTIADILKNLVMKYVYHNKSRLTDIQWLVTETYDPPGIHGVGGVEGTPQSKFLVPDAVRDIPNEFYNFALKDLGCEPMVLSQLLNQVERGTINRFFESRGLACSNPQDVDVLQRLLLSVCEFVGRYPVENIRWSGKISFSGFIPYVMANLSDYTVTLVDYEP